MGSLLLLLYLSFYNIFSDTLAHPLENLVDWRFLKSHWLRAFLAIIQEQEYPYIWGLYSKIDDNINF